MANQLYMKDKYENLWFVFHLWGLTSEGVSARWGFGERRKRRERKKAGEQWLHRADIPAQLHCCTFSNFHISTVFTVAQLHSFTIANLHICTICKISTTLHCCTIAKLYCCRVSSVDIRAQLAEPHKKGCSLYLSKTYTNHQLTQKHWYNLILKK